MSFQNNSRTLVSVIPRRLKREAYSSEKVETKTTYEKASVQSEFPTEVVLHRQPISYPIA